MEKIPHQDPVETFLEDRNHLVYQMTLLYRLGDEIIKRNDLSNPYLIAIQFLLEYFNNPGLFFEPGPHLPKDREEIKAALLPLLLEFEKKLNDRNESVPSSEEFITQLNQRINLVLYTVK